MFVCLIFIRFISHHLLLLNTVPFFLMTNIVYNEKAMFNHSFLKKFRFVGESVIFHRKHDICCNLFFITNLNIFIKS